MPPRDNMAAPTGTARISGRVVAADTGSPIRRAQINVNSREAQFNRSVTTDSEGRYELSSLPAGRYRLFVNKAGYVTLEYGQARPFEAGKPLDIADAQALDKIDFSLPRGSAITGRITDEFGDPITDVQVEALRYQFVNGERQLVNAGRSAQTDDLGGYRIFGLMPGDYIVRASMRPNMPGAPRAADVEPIGYPGTYYPGVSDISQAQTVTAVLGQELSSIAFALVPARLSRISGTVMGSDGRPLAGAMVMLRARNGGGIGALRMNIVNGGNNQVRPDGSFQLANVPPGDYVLDVQQRPQNVRSLQDINLVPTGVRVDARERVGRRHRQPDYRHHSGRDGFRTRGLPGPGRAEDDPVDASGRPAALRRTVPDRDAAQREGPWGRTNRTGQHIRASGPRRTADDSRARRPGGLDAEEHHGGWHRHHRRCL